MVSGAGASASVVCALLFVAPKSISPIDNPTTPTADPVGSDALCRVDVVAFKASSLLSASLAHHAPPVSYPNGTDPLNMKDLMIATGALDVSSVDVSGCEALVDRVRGTLQCA